MFYNFILIFFIFVSLNAKEPTMAILKNVYANDIQEFTYQNYTFTCRPYGIVTIEDVYRNDKISSTCRQRIKKFYLQHPKAMYYSQLLLNIEQMYHIEYKKKNNKFIIHVKGLKTLSELLVEKGLAVKEKYLKDEIYAYKFDMAQKRASYNKRGLHKDPVLKNCMIFFKRN